jgi:parallel beta-helix repeat protein
LKAKIVSLCIIGLFGILLVPSLFFAQTQLSSKKIALTDDLWMLSGFPHLRIYIDGDSNFSDTASDESWTGDGTEENPYIIQGYDFDDDATPYYAIEIHNTIANFTIIGCSFSNQSVGAIYLYNLQNANITGNTFNDTHDAIYFYNAHNSTVKDNIIKNSYQGIRLFGYDNIVNNNTCGPNNLNGISVWGGHRNIIANNTCNGNTQDGIGVYGADDTLFHNNTCNENVWGVWVSSGSNNFTSMNCSLNTIGIHMEGTSYTRIFDSYFGNNSEHGVELDTCATHLIYTSTFRHNGYMIGSGSGIFINTVGPLFLYWCNFEWNMRNVYQQSGEVYLNASYYSDYTGSDLDENGIGDTSYLSYYGIARDYNPAMVPWGSPPIWVNSPTSQIINITQSFYYDLNATASPPGPQTWSLNDTSHFDITEKGVITNNTDLSCGIYGIRVQVDDAYGRFITGNFSVTVRDFDSPTWVELPIDHVLELGDEFRYDLNATDLSDLDSWWLSDTENFTISTTGVITNITPLNIGEYELQVWVNDTSGNILTGYVNVTVEDTTDPVWNQNPTNQFAELGVTFEYDMSASDLGGIHHYWISDEENFTISENGLLSNNTNLEIGIYILNIKAYDPSDNYCEDLIAVTVQDTTPPEWASTPSSIVVEYGEAVDIQLYAWDLSGIASWLINDTTNFAISSDGRITNATVLIPGEFGLEITVSDNHGNQLSAEITIIVNDISTFTTTTTTTTTATTTTTTSLTETTTSTTTETETTSTGTTTSILGDVPLLLIIGSVGIVFIIIIGLILRRKS